MKVTLKKLHFYSTSLLATLALFVSAVSACACAHHQPPQETAEASSCHSASHETGSGEDAVQQDNAAAYFGIECDCIVRLPVPAIASKSGSLKLADSSASQIAELASLLFEERFVPLSPVPPEIDDVLSSFRSLHLASGPSRAPPHI